MDKDQKQAGGEVCCRGAVNYMNIYVYPVSDLTCNFNAG